MRASPGKLCGCNARRASCTALCSTLGAEGFRRCSPLAGAADRVGPYYLGRTLVLVPRSIIQNLLFGESDMLAQAASSTSWASRCLAWAFHGTAVVHPAQTCVKPR